MRAFMTWLLAFMVLVCAHCVAQHPIIGVYTLDADDPPVPFPEDHTYLPSSYIKNLEMAGAQVIPLFFHSSEEELQGILGQVNGVFFPGGNEKIDLDNQWTSNVLLILEHAKRQNRLGNPYPIWGTCLGFQALMYVTSGQMDNSTIFSDIQDQQEVVEPLRVYSRDSRLISTFGPEEYAAVTGPGVFFFQHHYCVLRETLEESQALEDFWQLVASGTNSEGVEFVAAVEAKEFPFFAVQFHPEKNMFEWRVGVRRSSLAIRPSQKLINLFVDISRGNRNTFADPAELQHRLIYNFQPLVVPLHYPLLTFMQIYHFDESDLRTNPYGYVSTSP